MKIAILGNRRDSFVRPMAEGLQRMLSEIGIEGEIFYDGLAALRNIPPRFRQYIQGGSNGSIAKNVFTYLVREMPWFYPFLSRLKQFDVVVIVNSLPDVFLRDYLKVETLRRYLPNTPIVLYDVFYLPTRGPWGRWLKEGKPEHGIHQPGNWGMDRYDWYLCGSSVSECPLPKGRQPCSLIGMNFNDGTLKPDRKDEFIALIDFEVPQHMHERAIQIAACKETKTKFVVLNGRYPIREIRNIYGQCSIFFVAKRESFGLPICEAQACGSYVFTPYANWCPSHWLKEDLSQEGPGDLSPNFIVYNNDKETLVREIQRIKAGYDPQKVVDTFLLYHPQLFYGDTAELKKFIQMVEKGEIHSGSHKEYAGITAPEFSSSFG